MAQLRIRGWASYAAMLPAAATALIFYVGTIVWMAWISVTPSKLVPIDKFQGLQNYQRLIVDARWNISTTNVAIFIVILIVFSLIIGTLLAMCLDQRIRGENTLRTLFLYPQGMSLIVTGLIWQWILNPTSGAQYALRSLGWTDVKLDWILNPKTALYVICAAGVWQASGLVMAILLSGLRSVDQTLRAAAKIDGIPAWRYYWNIVIPQIRPAYITAIVLLAVGGVKVYELVIAMTNGGPGISTEMPAKFVMDFLFRRANLGLSASASTVMLVTVSAIVIPWIYVEFIHRRKVSEA